MSFTLDPRSTSASHALATLPLCEARLQDDARFPWIVLAPRRPRAIELTDLDGADQRRLWREMLAAGRAVHAIGQALGLGPLKLNHGQLGNVVSQLHVHVVGRQAGDAAWPGPVWGLEGTEPYGREALERALAAARNVLG